MNPEFGYIFCSVLARARVYIGGVALELEDAGHPHAILFELDNGAWSRWSMEQRLAGICAFRDGGVDKLLCVGETGEVEVADSEGADEERIGDASSGPNALRPLRCVRIVGDHAYAAGAQRQVYRRRLDTAGWEAVDRGCAIARGSADIGSFHAIDGRDERLLVAVGMGGAVWRCADGVWQALESPAGAALECVLALGGERFLAGGAGGLLLSIDGASLRTIEHGLSGETFVDCAFGFGAAYLCTDRGSLFRFEADTLTRVDTGLAPGGGGGALSYADGLLVFVTDARVLSFDGARWTEHDPAAE
ncbi:hypothetical protein HF313_25685 [Massilia atriviolacea]|uniref:WD40 repeat domain-containing protein n=1 Tax=Massilia atriviolacea TaxID=2495579 RepID=A0A430HN63_9BURK|nr:hypothetical protein [Massilia atriviolacea]RSZ58939.1 hypothetical protein EJB06_11410 [Massilia atriviolacea]